MDQSTEATAQDRAVAEFIAHWRPSEGGERRTYQMFLTKLCDLLGVAAPEVGGRTYVFERDVDLSNLDGTSSRGRIDLYKVGCFVLEAKQGSFKHEKSEAQSFLPGLVPTIARKAGGKGHGVRGSKQWDDAMIRARAQAKRYADALPADEPPPPFLIVADVGYSFELFADFTGTGRHYTQFPDARSFRFLLDDLANPAIRERLRRVWEDPWSLDPSRHAARVTREIADRLAKLAKSLETRQSPKVVSDFLMRCLFTMFAEDVGILKERAFTELLKRHRADPKLLANMLTLLWREMDSGTNFSAVIADVVPRFNGALFKGAEALPLDASHIELLILAAQADWKEVEPAIFGTLLERALDPDERHRLGAHYTPRAYVERLVLPTIIEPLRAEWQDVKVAALTNANADDLDKAVAEVKAFHRRLCETTVLDPACGSGNFLYVTLEHMKRLEGEVLDLLANELGERQDSLELSGMTVDPHQFLGLEKNPRAVPIAEMVLWIGHLQWYMRTQPGFTAWPKPVLRQYGNVRAADALLTWREIALEKDDHGVPRSRWDGVSTKTDPITGREVPDETKRAPVERYVSPRAAEWPEAEYIIGNPPFIGGKDIRQELGDGYAEALWAAHGKAVPNSADFVMYWWNKAAEIVRAGKARRFGFITTNSLPQTFNRRVVEKQMSGRHPLGLLFAIPDHPWVKALNEDRQEAVRDAAQVRVAMTVGARGATEGRLLTVISEKRGTGDAADVAFSLRTGAINADLTLGADATRALPLRANEGLSGRGVVLHGAGFIVTPEQATSLGLDKIAGLERVIVGYRNGRDLAARPRGVMVIDLFGLAEADVRQRFPEVYQWVLERVKPERDHNKRDYRRENWWLFGENNPRFRMALEGLPRYIATVETAKHRTFQFLDGAIRPDNMLVSIASADAWILGALSSRIHVTWALAVGGRLGIGNDPRYNKSRCFDTFPFPIATDLQKDRIRALAEEIDALRKRQLAAHPKLTLTGIYNLLEKLRAHLPLSDDDLCVNRDGLVSTLLDLHTRLDAAVAEAYGWPADLPEEEILARLVALNAERRAEEVAGKVRWLRPEYQTSRLAAAVQPTFAVAEGEAAAPTERPAWPKALPEQVAAVRAVLPRLGGEATVVAIAKQFKGAKRERIAEILDVLAAVG